MAIALGRFNILKVVKKVDFGLYLDGGEEGRILLPARYVPQGCEVGDELNVFLYLDNEERLVATTQQPLAQVGDFACLRVAWVNQYGAFLDWGLMKDLFVPFREQRERMEVGRSYVVHVHLDDESYRIVASAKVERYLSVDERPPFQSGDEVDVLVWKRTDLGYKVIVDNRYAGLLFENQVFRPLRVGDKMQAYVRQVRPDGKIDLALQREGRGKVADFSEELLEYIRRNQGRIQLTDKSPAEDIYAAFGVSKKTFKQAVGDLYKRRLIRLEADGIRLL